MTRSTRAFLVALTLLAFGLRLSGLTWGVPLAPFTGYYHPDERKIVQGAVDFPGDMGTRDDLRYPTGYHYLVGTLALPARLLLADRADPGRLFLAVFMLARFLTLSLGLLSIPAVFQLGRRFYGPLAGGVAAAMLAVATVHAIHGAWATLDVPTAFATILALAACDRVMARPSRGRVLVLGALSGLLIGLKYPGGVILAPGLLSIVAGRRAAAPGAGWGRALLAPEIPLYLLVTALAVLATTPAILLNPGALAEAVRYERERQGLGGLQIERDLLVDVLGGLQTVVGRTPGGLFALAALAAALWRPGRREALLLAFLLPYYLVLGDRAGGRYLIVLLPVYTLLAGRLASLADAWLRARAPARPALVRGARALGGALLLAIWALGLRQTVAARSLQLQADARSAAARVLQESAPSGSEVCIVHPGERYPPVWKAPALPAERYPQVDCETRPRWVLVVGGLGRVERALADPALGPDYVWPADRAGDWSDDEVPSPERLRFYDALLPGRDGAQEYERVATFENEELPSAPYMVASVQVFRRLRDP